MSIADNWLIYGANGVTGRLITAQAVRAGQRPILAGRSAAKLEPLAKEFGLEWLSFELTDRVATVRALQGVSLVLNIAGPFEWTAPLLVEACLQTGTHYLDIGNEIGVFQKLLTYNKAAQQAGISIVPGVGYGAVATNFLARRLAAQLPGATHLELVTAAYNTHSSPAVNLSVLKVLESGGRIYRQGKLVPYRLGAGMRRTTFPETGEIRQVIPAPLGDLEAAYTATAIENITVYIPSTMGRLARLGLGLVPFMLKIKAFRRLARKSSLKPKLSGAGDPPKTLSAPFSFVWGKVSDNNGRQIESWLKLGEGYQFTALSSIKAVEKTLAHPKTGTLMPAQAFETDFISELEGVTELS